MSTNALPRRPTLLTVPALPPASAPSNPASELGEPRHDAGTAPLFYTILGLISLALVFGISMPA